MYYRGTSSNNPMSDWGHAMFVDNIDTAYMPRNGYHDYFGWEYDGSSATDIADLTSIIVEQWEADKAEHDETGWVETFSDLDDYYRSLTGEQVAEGANPSDIVDSAGLYDSDLVGWLYWRVLDPRGIMAVTTPDGAIVWDENLIKAIADSE